MKNFANLQTMFKSTATAGNSEQVDASVDAGTQEQQPTDAYTDTVADAAVEDVKDVEDVEDVEDVQDVQDVENVGTTSEDAATPEECEVSDELVLDEISKSRELMLKHPLQNVWTLWYLENDRTKSWEDMQNEITSFDTVEDFWSLYNHIKPPSEIKLGSDYSLFKKGIRPMWEDAANNNGGRWVIALNKILKDDLDKLWLDVLLCLIGEVFDRFDEICGAVVNIRGKSNKISIWTANGNNKEAILEIGHKLRDALRLGPQNLLQYQLHKDAMTKQGSNVKSTFTL